MLLPLDVQKKTGLLCLGDFQAEVEVNAPPTGPGGAKVVIRLGGGP